MGVSLLPSTLPCSSMVPWVQALCFPSQHPTPSKGKQQGFQNGDGLLSPSRLDRAARWAGERVHSAATLVDELECCLTTLEIPQRA